MSVYFRRVTFATLVISTIVALSAFMAASFSKGGYSLSELILLACFVVTLPWTAIGFWNAAIGFWLMRSKEDPAGFVFPALNSVQDEEEVTSSTAIAMCIRNEDVDQVYRNLTAMMARLVASKVGSHFHVYILSDSFGPEIIQYEQTQFAKLEREWQGKINVTYRRRLDNPGYKAGNIQDFCAQWGKNHEFFLTLDADSVMSASAILRMVRIMQKNQEIGILQSLVVGLPSDSMFTRVFQFGMRMGMKSYTLGSAWWQADCGPYWGHNALIRMKPFMEHCQLPKLEGNGPLSGWILSHDQVEAVYMRKAGYECRVLADEGGSYEENPPNILEFIRRDLRWCHGNMQYFKLLKEPGLKLTSRIQLLLAILMFIGSPAWMLFVIVGTLSYTNPERMTIKLYLSGSGYYLFAIIMMMIFAPKITSIVDVMLNPVTRKQYGGVLNILAGAVVEFTFSMMLAPIMAIANSIFLFQLFVLRKPKAWPAQSRHTKALAFGKVFRKLWPQMIFGLVGFTFLFNYLEMSWVIALICVPVFVGPLFAIPFALTTSLPSLGALGARLGIWCLPEEKDLPVIIRALHLPALALHQYGKAKNYQPLSTQELLDLESDAEVVTISSRSH